MAVAVFTAPDRSPCTIGANVQISRSFATERHYETQVAADPDDRAHLVAGAYVVNPDGSVDTVFYVSFDRGSTWTRTLRVKVGTDPSVALGTRGVAFAAT